MRAIYQALQTAFHDDRSAIHRRLEKVIYALIAFSVAFIGVEIWLGPEHPLVLALNPVDQALLWFFGLEILLRVGTYAPPALEFYAPNSVTDLRSHLLGRLVYCTRPLVLIDLVTVLALVPALRGLRAVRLLRLLRGARVFRYSNPFGGLARAFQENTSLLLFGLSWVGLSTLVGGLSLFMTEYGSNPDVTRVSEGMWWAIVTLTTVGYGDISPVTGLGRAVASLMMLNGMFTLALFAGIVGHALLNAVLTIREEQFRMSSHINHLVVCGYDPGSRMLLKALQDEFVDHGRDTLLFANGERPADTPADFRWVPGDPTKESELDKVRMARAAVVVIVGSRTLMPQQADAQTILTAFTIRAYLKAHPETAKRARPMYLIAEILDHENVAHARAAGCDEVIETTLVGYSLLAHAASMPGTAEILSNVAAARAHNLYVGLPTEYGDFRTVAAQVKATVGALVIGYRDPTSGEDILNPPDTQQVPEGAKVIYLSEEVALPL